MQWVPEWSAAALPEGDAVIATAWQSVEPVAARADRAAAGSSTSSSTTRASTTARRRGWTRPIALPLRKIVISTWLADIMAERFDTPAAVVVTPVDGALFRPVPVEDDGRLRVLMLFHEYPWKGVADGLEAVQPGAGASSRAQPGGLRGQAAAAQAAVRRVPREPAAGAPGVALQPLPDLSLPVVGRGPRHAPDGGDGLRRRALSPTTTAAVATTPSTAAPRWCRRGVIWTRWPGGSTRLVEDAELRKRIARQGQDFVGTQFDWERATARLELLLAAR